MPTTDDDLATVEKFDYWQRRTKAEALVEAADYLVALEAAQAHIGDAECEGPSGASVAYARFEAALEDPERWLRERAAGVMDGSL